MEIAQSDNMELKQVFTRPESSLEEAQRWILNHKDAHKPYTKRKRDGVWVDSNGEKVSRDVGREKTQIEFYLEQLKTRDLAHYKLINDLSRRIAPMAKETRVAVNIPAWMEGKNLYNLLIEYTRQTDKDGNPINQSLFEINIIVNRRTGTNPDNSVTEIKRFIEDSGIDGNMFLINYIDLELDPPFDNVGNARRIITDLTLLRSIQRSEQTGSLYIESEDADLIRIDNHTVINLINTFDQNPQYDALLGRQDRFPEILMQNDYLFLYRRIDDFRKLILSRRRYEVGVNPNADFLWNRTFTGGWNTGYTAEAYALIGGYDPLMAWGEDLMIGVRISMARSESLLPNTDVIGKTHSRTDSSPRRFIYSIASDDASYGDNFINPKINETIRNESIPKLLDRIKHIARIDETNIEIFQNLFNFHFNYLLQCTPTTADAIKDMKRIMLFLGFKLEDSTTQGDYTISADKGVLITNYQNLKESLNSYRKKHSSKPI